MSRICLLILDGAGYSTDTTGNVVTAEMMPVVYRHMAEYGFAVLGATSEHVGLEPGQVGNSEAGHLTIGAGRQVPCLTQRINASFHAGDWARDSGWRIAANAGVLHVLGLLSDAGVHALARTIVQSVDAAIDAGVRRIVVHPVLDGVDSPAGSAPALIDQLRDALRTRPFASLGVVIGRRWFCDRGGDTTISQVAADAFLGRHPLPTFTDQVLSDHLSRSGSEADFPAHLVNRGRAVGDNEPLLITSHRADRARQMAGRLAKTHPVLMLVDPGGDIPVEHVFFPQKSLDRSLAHEFKQHGLRSLRIAEKCKFPHVTYFFNGFDTDIEGEGICVPSIAENQIADNPQMSIHEVVELIVSHLSDPQRRVIVANLANLDQVGHLGRLDLARHAARHVDRAFARISEQARKNGWTLLVTADHGNADCVVDEHDRPFGSHTHRPVPFLVQPPPNRAISWLDKEGTLTNVAATCLEALDLPPPSWMAPALMKLV